MGWGVVASILGAGLGAKSAGDAADAQRSAAVGDRRYQEKTRDLIFNRLDPFYAGGTDAQSALDYELGLGAKPSFGGTPLDVSQFNQGGRTQYRVGDKVFGTKIEAEGYARQSATGGMEYGGYTKTPGYDFRMQEGQNAIESSAAARGGLYSGAALRDSLKYGQDYASNEYGNYLARLTDRAGVGMGAATGQAVAAGNAAQGVSNALAGAGNAAAAGAIGRGNAFVGGLQNLATNWNYQKNMGGGMNGNGAWANPMFGGPGLGNLF